MNTADLVTAFYADLWNRWDETAVNRVLSNDFTFRGSLGLQTRGREEWRNYRDLIHAGSSDFHNEIQTLVIDGDRAAARLRYTGTHDGPLVGRSPTGRRFSYAGAAFFTVRQQQLADAWVLGDLAGLHRQLAPERHGVAAV
jgi:predicted ester cyclase